MHLSKFFNFLSVKSQYYLYTENFRVFFDRMQRNLNWHSYENTKTSKL